MCSAGTYSRITRWCGCQDSPERYRIRFLTVGGTEAAYMHSYRMRSCDDRHFVLAPVLERLLVFQEGFSKS